MVNIKDKRAITDPLIMVDAHIAANQTYPLSDDEYCFRGAASETIVHLIEDLADPDPAVIKFTAKVLTYAARKHPQLRAELVQRGKIVRSIAQTIGHKWNPEKLDYESLS